MKKHVRILKDYCRRQGMRFTPEREAIVEEAYRKDSHFDADELYLRIRENHPGKRISKGSVYRTLPLLIRAGLVRESYTEAGRKCFEYVLGHAHHDHMKCLNCGKVFEFIEKEIDKAQQRICDRKGFSMVWHMHVLVGYCADCGDLRTKRESAHSAAGEAGE